MQIQLREMRSEDWPEVKRIYEEGLATGIATLDTEVPDWEQWDENHIDTCRIVQKLTARLPAGPLCDRPQCDASTEVWQRSASTSGNPSGEGASVPIFSGNSSGNLKRPISGPFRP